MNEITVRELRNEGGRVLDRVARGETLTVTRDGEPVADLRPLPRRPLPAAMLTQAPWTALATTPQLSEPERRVVLSATKGGWYAQAA